MNLQDEAVGARPGSRASHYRAVLHVAAAQRRHGEASRGRTELNPNAAHWVLTVL